MPMPLSEIGQRPASSSGMSLIFQSLLPSSLSSWASESNWILLMASLALLISSRRKISLLRVERVGDQVQELLQLGLELELVLAGSDMRLISPQISVRTYCIFALYCIMLYKAKWRENMASTQIRPKKQAGKKKPSSKSVMLRLDAKSKALLQKAAKLRHTSVSDYIRSITLAQAQKEIQAAEHNLIVMTPEQQLAFWNALNEPVVLTPAQERLGRIMRGEE